MTERAHRSERVAVVTGASGGVGRAIALGLAGDGTSLHLVGRRRDALEAVADAAHQAGAEVSTHVTDLAIDEDIHGLAVSLQRAHTGVDVLVHAAGVIALGAIADASVEGFDLQFRTNTRGPYLLTKLVLPMLKQRRGQVVFINSSAGLTSKSGAGQYGATKAALKAVADSLRDEMNADGIRVLSVFLGRTATGMQAAIHDHEGRVYHPERLIQPQDVAVLLAGVLRLPPTVEVTEITLRPAQKPAP